MKYYMIPYCKELDLFKEELILPIEDYSIGFDIYFSFNEIIEISKKRKVNVIINRFLHKDDISNIRDVINNLSDYVELFFVEDLGLLNIIDKEKIVLYQNHIINNYESINAYYKLGIKNIVINNDLTLDEINTISEKSLSNLFIFGIAKNNLMYSKRKLLSSYKDYSNLKNIENNKIIKESVSKKELIIKEEKYGTLIFEKDFFSINDHLNCFDKFNVIINFSNSTDNEKKIILNNYMSDNLNKMIDVNDYFLNNKIIYKLGVKK